jgi:hypothetical protein
MTYRINKTDGNQLVDLPDGTFDTDSTSITLIGRNVTSFGEALNENLVKLLENFASSSAPESALKGQLWYDTGSGRLNVYDGLNFRAAGGPVISPRNPTDLVAGDLWLNNLTNQLWFYDGLDLTLAGPIYTNQQGRTGFIVETVLDTLNRSHTIAKLFVANSLIGIFSADLFTPAQPIVGYSTELKSIKVGFNVSGLADTKFDVTVTKTENILTAEGTLKNSSQILYNDEDQVIVGSLTVQSDNGVIIGASEDVDFKIASGTPGKFVIEQKLTGQDFGFKSKTPTGTREAITIDATNSRIGFWTETPTADVDINGNLKVAGDLIIGGESVTINTTVLQVEDKNIELGVTPATPSDTAADGGGITLLGTTDKTITWEYNSDTPTNSNWTLSEHINIVPTKTYKIDNTEVLSSTTLGSTVVNSSLTSVGNLIELNMAGGITSLTLETNTISTGNGNIIISPGVGGFLSLNNKGIVDIANPRSGSTGLQDATSRSYVDDAVFRRNISLSMDITNLADNEDIADILDDIAPFYDPVTSPTGIAINGTQLRLHGTVTSVTVSTVSYTPTEDVGLGGDFSRITVRNAAGTGTESVIQDISTTQVLDAPLATVTVTRVNKLFTMTLGNWVWDSDF